MPPHRDTALILGAHTVALGAARSLGRRGIDVTLVATDPSEEARASRYVRRTLEWDPAHPAPGDQLSELVRRHRLEGATVFAGDDSTALLLGREHDRLAELLFVASPPWDKMRWAHDKALTDELAQSLGIPSPRTVVPDGPDALAELGLRFPVVLKPARKTAPGRLVEDKAWRADDVAELVRRYAQAMREMPPGSVMVQELIPGDGTNQLAFAALCHRGSVLAWLTACRRRQHPIDFGRASTFVQTVDDDAVVEMGHRLLEKIGYTGLVELEFKRDPREGSRKLLDINTRLWGWHSLGMRAGVDFPWLAWRLARGEPVPTARARVGVRWVRMRTDLPAARSEIRAGRLTLGGYLRSVRPPLETAVFAADDPLPAVTGASRLTRHALARLLRRR